MTPESFYDRNSLAFLCIGKFRWNLLTYKKPYRAGSHCGGKIDAT